MKPLTLGLEHLDRKCCTKHSEEGGHLENHCWVGTLLTKNNLVQRFMIHWQKWSHATTLRRLDGARVRFAKKKKLQSDMVCSVKLIRKSLLSFRNFPLVRTESYYSFQDEIEEPCFVDFLKYMIEIGPIT